MTRMALYLRQLNTILTSVVRLVLCSLSIDHPPGGCNGRITTVKVANI
jgi:hypothetical protein